MRATALASPNMREWLPRMKSRNVCPWAQAPISKQNSGLATAGLGGLTGVSVRHSR